jgi:hypothetical protein
MGCFRRGEGLANLGGNCAIWKDVPDAQACQYHCQETGCCEYWNYHKGNGLCSGKFTKGTTYKNDDLISGAKVPCL